MSWEIDRHDWASFRASGTASQIPVAVRSLQIALTEQEAMAAYWRIDNTVVVQGAVYEAALPTIPCLLDILQSCTRVARPAILELLVQIGMGEPAEVELEAGNSSVVIACRKEIARGLPLFVHILETAENRSECGSCIDLVGLCCELDPTLRERARWYLEATKSNAAWVELRTLIDNWLAEI